jgi:hypothetical protein
MPAPSLPRNTPRRLTYTATDIITGEILADAIPLTVQSLTRQVNAAGTLTGSLALTDTTAATQPYVEALEATRCVLWALQDGFPVWSGIVWDWPHQSVTPPAVLPLQAQTLESLFARRVVTDTLSYPGIDVFKVFSDLLSYGMSKNSPYITAASPPANRLPAAATDAMRVAGLAVPDITAGVPWTGTVPYSDYRKVADVWNDLISAGGFEFTFEPGLDGDGNYATAVRLGLPALGRPADQSGLAFFFPGNVLDYAYPRTGSQGANALWATAPPNGSAASWQSLYPHGFDLGQLAAGYPLLEDTVSWASSAVTAQPMIDAYADSQMGLRTQQMTTPTLVVGGGGTPGLQEVVLGDWAWLTATSPLHPARGTLPGLQAQVRVTGWSYVPPAAGQPEALTVYTSGVTGG